MADSSSPEQRGRFIRSPRLWAPLALFFALAFVAVSAAFALSGGDTVVEQKRCTVGEPGCEARRETHEHADFAIYLRGNRVDFTPLIEPEHDHGSTDDHAGAHEATIETADMHLPRSTVVHVHLDGATWDEFLRTLKFDLLDQTLGARAGGACLKVPSGERFCEGNGETFKFYVNGVKVDGVANQKMHDLDRVLISFGREDASAVAQQLASVSDEACIASESCRDRLPPGGELAEPCSKSSKTCR